MFQANIDYFSEVKKLDELSIYLKYIPNLSIDKLISSPLRNDSIPSFKIGLLRNGKYCWVDFGTGKRGDCINLVMELHGLDFSSACEKIYNEFKKIEIMPYPIAVRNHVKKKNSKVEIGVKIRPCNSYDLDFWKQFGITSDILNLYHVYPLKAVYFNEHRVACKELAYCFIEKKDSKFSYKIYQPYNKEYKWYSSHDFSVLQGFSKLPETGELLIVSKSLKDVIVLKQFGYSAIAPQSENSFIKPNVLKQLQDRFKRVVIFFDNDIPGLEAAEKFSKKFNLEYIFIPLKKDCKDISDYYKFNGEEKTKQLLKQLLNGTKKCELSGSANS